MRIKGRAVGAILTLGLCAGIVELVADAPPSAAATCAGDASATFHWFDPESPPGLAVEGGAPGPLTLSARSSGSLGPVTGPGIAGGFANRGFWSWGDGTIETLPSVPCDVAGWPPAALFTTWQSSHTYAKAGRYVAGRIFCGPANAEPAATDGWVTTTCNFAFAEFVVTVDAPTATTTSITITSTTAAPTTTVTPPTTTAAPATTTTLMPTTTTRPPATTTVPTDSDHDGILDGADACPSTPAGTQVDPKGCPRIEIRVDDSGANRLVSAKVLEPTEACPARVAITNQTSLFWLGLSARPGDILQSPLPKPAATSLLAKAFGILPPSGTATYTACFSKPGQYAVINASLVDNLAATHLNAFEYVLDGLGGFEKFDKALNIAGQVQLTAAQINWFDTLLQTFSASRSLPAISRCLVRLDAPCAQRESAAFLRNRDELERFGNLLQLTAEAFGPNVVKQNFEELKAVLDAIAVIDAGPCRKTSSTYAICLQQQRSAAARLLAAGNRFIGAFAKVVNRLVSYFGLALDGKLRGQIIVCARSLGSSTGAGGPCA